MLVVDHHDSVGSREYKEREPSREKPLSSSITVMLHSRRKGKTVSHKAPYISHFLEGKGRPRKRHQPLPELIIPVVSPKNGTRRHEKRQKTSCQGGGGGEGGGGKKGG